MGLDNFRSGNDNKDEDENSDNDDITADDTSSSVDNDTDESDGETVGGLESFKSSSSRGGNNDDGDSDKKDHTPFGIESGKWNNMSPKEIVATIREEEIPDFRPDVQLDDRWSYREVIEVRCVCGNTFYFTTKGLCFECGRSYGKEERTVRKLSDPEGVTIYDSEEHD